MWAALQLLSVSAAGAGPTAPFVNYTERRAALWRAVFNTTTDQLPTTSTPDYVEDHGEYEMRGLPGPGQGTGVGDVSWKMGLQKLVWTIGERRGGMQEGMLRPVN